MKHTGAVLSATVNGCLKLRSNTSQKSALELVLSIRIPRGKSGELFPADLLPVITLHSNSDTLDRIQDNDSLN